MFYLYDSQNYPLIRITAKTGQIEIMNDICVLCGSGVFVYRGPAPNPSASACYSAKLSLTASASG